MELSVAQPPGRPESRLGHPVIDMRCRPSFLHRFFGAEPGTPEFATVRWLNGRVGSRDPDHFTRARDLEGLLAELGEAGITRAVMVARSTPQVDVPNDALAALADRSGGRLIGVASVDPTVRGRDASLAELHRAVLGLGLAGLNVDAGFYATALSADDERLMPLYEACAELGVPAFIMSGPTTPDLRLNDPLAVDAVARAFPGLSIVCCHGFYPNVDAMLAVAFRNPNVFVSPDMYVFAPGGGRYVEAANGFLADQFLFGTSYPFRPLRQSVEDFLGLGLAPESLRKAMADNPARLLRLPG
jgi:predicted TIM-barrel fold metal-dependent hydrolase